MLVWIDETTDAMIKLDGSAVCSRTSADVSSGWDASGWGSSGWSSSTCGASCGWEGDGICCVWTSEEEGEDCTGIGDLGGGEGAAVLWCFAWVPVLLVPFLFG